MIKLRGEGNVKISSGVVKSAVLLAAAVCLPVVSVYAATEQVEVTAYATTTGDFGSIKAAPEAGDSVVIGKGNPVVSKFTVYGAKDKTDFGAGVTDALDIRDKSGNQLLHIANDGTLMVKRIASLDANPIEYYSDTKYVSTNLGSNVPPGPKPSGQTPGRYYSASVKLSPRGAVWSQYWRGTISGPIKTIMHLSYDHRFYDGGLFTACRSNMKITIEDATTGNNLVTPRSWQVQSLIDAYGSHTGVTSAVNIAVPIYIPTGIQRAIKLLGNYPASHPSGLYTNGNAYLEAQNLYIWFEDVDKGENATGWPG